MKNLYNLIRKEMKELITRQFIFTLVAMVAIYGVMGKFIGGVIEEQETKPIMVSILDLDQTSISRDFINKMNERGEVEIEVIDERNREEALEKTRERGEKTLLIMPAGFGERIEQKRAAELEAYSIIKGMSMTAFTGRSVLEVVNSLSRQMSLNIIEEIAPDWEATDLVYPLRAKEFVVVEGKAVPGSLGMIEGFAMSQSVLIPVVLMMAIMYSAMMVIGSMGMEKENKTLETLLTLPVKRSSIVVGKMAGAAIVALIMAAVYMIGFTYYMSALTPETSGAGMTALKELGLMMTPVGYLLLGVSLFMAILTALSLAMILGLFVQDSRSAQSMAMPIVLLVIFPFIVMMFKDLGSLPLALKVAIYLIPFSHPTIAARALVFRDYLPVIAGIIYMGLFAATLIYITIRIFNADKVLTARFSFGKRKRDI